LFIFINLLNLFIFATSSVNTDEYIINSDTNPKPNANLQFYNPRGMGGICTHGERNDGTARTSNPVTTGTSLPRLVCREKQR